MTISFLIAAAVVLIVLLPTFIKIAQEYERLVIFRLGRCIGEKGPGLVLLIPFVDRPVRVDLRSCILKFLPRHALQKTTRAYQLTFLFTGR